MEVEADQTDPFWMLKKLQCELLDTNNETIKEDMEERYSHPYLGLPDSYILHLFFSLFTSLVIRFLNVKIEFMNAIR
jgi:hypothetical protein